MVCFQTQNPNLGKNFRASDWKMLIYFTAIWNILWIFMTIWYILCSFGTFFPVLVACTRKIWQPCQKCGKEDSQDFTFLDNGRKLAPRDNTGQIFEITKEFFSTRKTVFTK
jgi:hypothetical protein